MSRSVVRKFFSRLFSSESGKRTSRERRSHHLRAGLHPRFEPLEQRQLLTVSATYFDDGWSYIADTDMDTVLSNGDIVSSSYSGGTVQTAYGVSAFGTVPGKGSVMYSATINDAIDNTTSGGSVTVMPLSANYADSVDIDKRILLSGSFTMDSGNDLSMTADGAYLVPTAITLSGGDLTLSDGTLKIGVYKNGYAGHINVTGAVDLTGSTLAMDFGDYDATVSTHYTIIDNDGTDAITGTFAGLADNATFKAGERTLRIDYDGGTGNDVVLTVLSQVNPFQSYVNDNWYDVTDSDNVPNAGHDVDDSNDTGSTAVIANKFELPNQSNSGAIYMAAYDNVQNAVDATATRGTVSVLPGTYSGGVTLDEPMALQALFSADYSTRAGFKTCVDRS